MTGFRHVALAPAPASGIAGGFQARLPAGKAPGSGLWVPLSWHLAVQSHWDFLLPAEKAWEPPESQRLSRGRKGFVDSRRRKRLGLLLAGADGLCGEFGRGQHAPSRYKGSMLNNPLAGELTGEQLES